MVRNTFYKINIIGGLAVMGTASLLAINPVQADGNSTTLTATVGEMLTVSIDAPDKAAEGATGDLLTNDINLKVSTNNATGFTASMTTDTTETALTNSADSSAKIPALEGVVAGGSFTSDRWGYSYDGGTNYRPVAALGSATPSYVASSPASTSTIEKTIRFGAKASAASVSGNYQNSVVISVVSGVNTGDPNDGGSNPTTPANPVTPSTDTDSSDTTGTYSPANAAGSDTGATVYTYTSITGSGTSSQRTTTTTQVNKGDTSATQYAKPLGVTNTVATVNEGTPLATGLAVGAAVMAVAGVAFFAVAKHRQKIEDQEEDF